MFSMNVFIRKRDNYLSIDIAGASTDTTIVLFNITF